MAGSQGSRLAIAVCEAGALGSVPCAMLTLHDMQTELRAIKDATNAPFNVNFFCHEAPTRDATRESAWRRRLLPYYNELGISQDSIFESAPRAPFSSGMADLLEEFEPAVVSFHFGLPTRALVDRVKAWGSLIMSTATTVAEAQWLEANGADVIIAQGFEAGGHRGMFLTTDITTQIGTLALVPQVVRAVSVPVIAAGGIGSSAGVQAALALGAGAAQVGTAFLLCTESSTSAVHREALKSERAVHTGITNIFTGRPARAIINRAVREIGPMDSRAPEFPLAVTAMFPLRAKLEERGNSEFTPLWAGQNASACREISAADVVRELSSADRTTTV
ncbi:MAG: nitronate monooxygenase [Phycisphaerae bacterium]|nr:nitronate monooxygenase [Gemmatimonadaceae bacterium]